MKFLKTLALTTMVAVSAVCAVAQAQDAYPNKTVTLLVPYPAGGASDAIARLLNVELSKQLNQTVIVENLGGVSGALAAQKLLSAPSDGYIIFQGSPNELILSPLANAAVKFKSEDFRLVQMIAIAPLAIIARKDLPATNADELVAYAQKMAKEGKPVTYASVGNGSFYHLLGEQMSKTIGAAMTHVPYKGGGPAMQDLMGGQLDIFISPYGKPQIELAKQGRLKFLASLSPVREEALKDVPSVNEGKALKGFTHEIWTGYFVKKDTPEPVVQAIHKAITATLSNANVRESLIAQSAHIATPLSLADAAKAYTEGTAQFRAIAKSIDLKAQ
jgi:tripartite-type tricarboxylate transporter receptor subunit TctC